MASTTTSAPSPPTTVPSTMRAWTFSHRGSPASVLRLSSLPTPQPSILRPAEVIVKVSHASLNIGFTVLFHLLPHFSSVGMIPEIEFCGTVVALGSHSANNSETTSAAGEANVSAGDTVIGVVDPLTMYRHNGALAEYVVARKDYITLKPANLSNVEGSGLAGVGWTAVCACDAAGLKSGDKVLVNGGSGALGSMLVQVAKGIVGESGKVVAVCSGRNEGLVRGLGADEIIDYTVHSPLHSYLIEHHSQEPFNAIFDVIGNQDLHTHCPAYLAKSGLYDLLGNMGEVSNPSWWTLLAWLIPAKLERFRPVILGGVPRRHRMHNAFINQVSLRRVAKMAEEGKMKVLTDSVWAMEEAIKAYEKSTSMRARGKIVIEVHGQGERP